MRSYNYLSRETVKKYLPDMIARSVSVVARKKGFTKMYLSGQDPRLVMATKNQSWHDKRHNFLKRHLAAGHKLYKKNGELSRYHLSLIAWSYSPSRKIRRENQRK